MARYTSQECLEMALERFEPEYLTEEGIEDFLETAILVAEEALEAAGIEPDSEND